jgi:hypothetical protein
LNSIPYHIQRFKPTIRRGLISSLSPDTLLNIQSGLVGGKVLQTQSCVGLDEKVHLFPPMPLRPVYVEPNRISLKSAVNLPQAIQKAFSVPLGPPQQALAPQQRSNPSKDIQSLTMLTRCHDPETSSNLGPLRTKARVQGKACLIFKNNRFFRSQGLKFFLTCLENAWPLRFAPEDTYSLPASSGSPVDASMTEPDVPSRLSQNDVSSVPLKWARPTELDSGQILQGISPDDPLILYESEGLSELVAQAFSQAPTSSAPAHLPCASTDSSFDAIDPTLRLSIPDADPPISAVEPQSLFLNALLGFDELWPTNAPGLLRDAPTLD